jgi:hypothetical protein
MNVALRALSWGATAATVFSFLVVAGLVALANLRDHHRRRLSQRDARYPRHWSSKGG